MGAVILLKGIRNPKSKNWAFKDVGKNIHTDHHAFAFHPTDNMTIFAGNDGGIYKSTDGGITWDDAINEGLCITQCEFMDQHPDSDAVVIIGTQDNGTLQFRNNPAFYFCDGSDGGFAAIDPKNPNIIYHNRYCATFGVQTKAVCLENIKKEEVGNNFIVLKDLMDFHCSIHLLHLIHQIPII